MLELAVLVGGQLGEMHNIQFLGYSHFSISTQRLGKYTKVKGQRKYQGGQWNILLLPRFPEIKSGQRMFYSSPLCSCQGVKKFLDWCFKNQVKSKKNPAIPCVVQPNIDGLMLLKFGRKGSLIARIWVGLNNDKMDRRPFYFFRQRASHFDNWKGNWVETLSFSVFSNWMKTEVVVSILLSILRKSHKPNPNQICWEMQTFYFTEQLI